MLFEHHLQSFRSFSMLWFRSVMIYWLASLFYNRCLISWILLLICSYRIYIGKLDVFLMIAFYLYYPSSNLLTSVIWVGSNPLLTVIRYNLFLILVYWASGQYIDDLVLIITYSLGLKWSPASIHFYERPIHWFLRQNTSLTPWLGHIHGINCISWFCLLQC
jgi:hypothetical protein